ncbi:hypothetical protein ABZ891_29670 [Streptomyces sp. NPDC047023]|uniref:hypothetical protein n=1 Tax=Streptomyces sp. NPDC047023 TaxID=3155139 RepID=UPI0033CE07E2
MKLPRPLSRTGRTLLRQAAAFPHKPVELLEGALFKIAERLTRRLAGQEDDWHPGNCTADACPATCPSRPPDALRTDQPQQ